MSHTTLTFIIKTSFSCNMNCAYCYEGRREQGKWLTRDSAEVLINKAAHYARDEKARVNFLWHGGEPLLLGQDFYQHVIDTQKSLSFPFCYNNMLQTNGLLLDKHFTSFLVKNNFKVGTSLDGPQKLHDAQRRSKSGQPTHKLVCQAITQIQKQNGAIGVVAIFTRNTLSQLDEFYNYFSKHKINVRVNPLLPIGNGADVSAKSLHVTPQEYGKSLIYLFDRWIKEPRYTFTFNPFYNIVGSVMSGRTVICSQSGSCRTFFKVHPNGDVYPCGKEDERDYLVGNIHTDDMRSMVESSRVQQYAAEKAAVKELCGDCRHFNICNGGCTTSARLTGDKGVGKDFFCESYRMLFDHIKARLPEKYILTSQPASNTTLC